MAESTLILVNPKARTGQIGSRWKGLEHEVLGAMDSGTARVVMTTEQDRGSLAVRGALREGVRRIVVVGGDGTLSEAVQGFFDGEDRVAPDAELAVIPAGRGDDFFKSLTAKRWPRAHDAWKAALDILKKGRSKPVDIGRVRWVGSEGPSRYFINIASFGFPGLVVDRVARGAGKTAWTYLAQSTWAMLQYRPLSCVVRVDDRIFYEGPFFSAFVMNGRFNAGGICWSSDAKIDDGLFQFLLFEPRGIMETLATTSHMISGQWAGLSGIHSTTGKKIEVRCELARSHSLFEIDGDLPEPSGIVGADLEVIPGAIRLLS